MFRWELSGPASELQLVAELVQEIRDRLLRINFAGQPWGDDAVVMAALYVIQAWSTLDQQVERLLGYGQ